ncbi:MAG TPA: hypothetical protein VKC90_04525 [Chitinophagaceae bacterium]|nr:hypothetical protein [Chitinophagaceae bacterium]
MIEDKELYSRLNELKQRIPEKEWIYYHLLGVENFIYHLKNISNERSRERTINAITNYLDLVYEKTKEDSRSIEKGKELAPSIWKLSDIYRHEVGFIRKPDYLIISIIVICLFFLLKISLNTFQAFGISVLVFAGYMIYGYIKIKAKKVY